MTQNTQAVATRPGNAVVSLKQLVETPAYAARFRQILDKRAPQFVASLIQVGSSQQLRNCEPHSVIAAAITAASLDLPIDKNLGFAHIVPYGNQAQFQIGYKGFIQLALRTGQYKKMNAKPINQAAVGGYDEVGEPIILWDKLDETEPAVGYAFAWQTVTGFTKVIYWPKAKVEQHAQKYSKAYKSNFDTPWKSNFGAMALKTVVKDGLSHWGIMSVELRQAIQMDQSVQNEVDADPTYPDNMVAAKAKLGGDKGAPAAGQTIDVQAEPVPEGDFPPGAEVPPAQPANTAPAAAEAPKRRGRPPGSKNKPVETPDQAAAAMNAQEAQEPEPPAQAPVQPAASKPAAPAQPVAPANPPASGGDDIEQSAREFLSSHQVNEDGFCAWFGPRFHLPSEIPNLAVAAEVAPARLRSVCFNKWPEFEPEIRESLKTQAPA